MSALSDAADTLQAILRQEAEAARQVALPALAGLMRDKQAALEVLARAGLPETAAERAALRGMMLAAEENALVLGAVAGALESVRDRLRLDLSQAADPGLYGPGPRGAGPGRQRRPLRHTLAASLDREA